MSQNHSSDIFIGLMSGTSLDGVDIAIVDFANYPPTTLYSHTVAYADEMRQGLSDLTHSSTVTLDHLYGLEAELSQVYARVVSTALENASLSSQQIAALGCHGQTIRHRPDIDLAYTAQLLDPGRLAVLTGITTIGDFRRKDIALGGQGAPLAPAFHQFMFRSDSENRVVINLGGIANVTFLPADSNQPVTGFDTGPSNTLLDFWTTKHLGKSFDHNGEWARGGQVIDELLGAMLEGETYFKASAPKSTGTEYFSPTWLKSWLNSEYDARNVQATLVELSAQTVASAIKKLPATVDSCFICGGGAQNSYLLERIETSLDGLKLQSTQNLGIDPDFVEASAFAWLARARLRLQPGNIPGVTAASRTTVLGGVYHAD